ncbi:hypothetical protein [Chitinophaga nivalis]|uniref:HTH luxR-type domain-containing protein n=1 Tax=Chitinophaga nivalis TaxID=2991709 RepID=A0ABT3IJG0_9BACT|nr:hypothetical protein [Chitinophaga nivalis]MCW3466415.1 hypothetical protein [Chitinophaga nivalis]MCW3483894.1 hypothetical protein [Chitinophaga nivalis]
MKSLPYLLFICLCSCISGLSSHLWAQQPLPDSLQAVVNAPGSDKKNKPALLHQLAEIYRINKNYAGALTAARQSATIALQCKNYPEASKAYTLLVAIKANMQQYADLKQTSDSALSIAQQANDPIARAYAYYSRILLYKTLENPTDMVKYGQLGLKQLEKTNDPFIAAKIYYQLYVVHSDWNNEEKVYTYAQAATENARQANDYNLLSNCYTALSVAHEYKYNATKNKLELDSVLFYLNKPVMLYRQYPGSVSPNTYAIACINIANSYLKYFPADNPTTKAQAINYATLARSAVRNVDNSEEIEASSLGILSEYAKREGDLTQTESHLLAAYYVMKTAATPYYYTMINVVQALSDLYEQKGDYKRALAFQKEATLYNNKNFNQQKALNTQKLEMQYETEKKNNEMQLLKEREKSRTRQNYLYACIALASAIGLVFMFRSYHFRLRYSLQREKQLQLENKDTEMQVKLEKEEHARLKAEHQLLSTQQEQLKKEAMANILQLEHKHQMLLNIKDKLTEDNSINMQKIVKEEMVIDSDFELAKVQIQQIHPDFFHLINEKAQRKLTLLDLKLCTYLYLKMDTRQIAQLMNIETKSVRMSRYRIKQKLGLDKEDDLHAFLQGLGN